MSGGGQRGHDVSMHSSRLRIAAVLIAASATLLALTSCAPASGKPSADSTTSNSTTKHHVTTKPKPKITPKPAGVIQPASRYAFGCSDLIPANAVATLYSTPMSPVDSTDFDQQNLLPQLPSPEYLNALGALDCTWYDGAKITGTNHEMELQVIPVTLAEWDKFAQGGAAQITNGVSTDCESDQGLNTCDYEAYVNGSRYELNILNMTPVPGSNNQVLPAAVQAVVTGINTKLNSAPAGPLPAAQHPSVTLPAGPAMITVAQVRTALGVGAGVSLEVDCTGQPDGPWEIPNEAQQQVTGGADCEFGVPYDGGTEGPYVLYEFIPAGGWAAKQIVADTPSATAVADPSLPAGDSLYEYTDSTPELTGVLSLGGNLVEFEFFPTANTGDPATSVPQATALVNVANAFEATARS